MVPSTGRAIFTGGRAVERPVAACATRPSARPTLAFARPAAGAGAREEVRAAMWRRATLRATALRTRRSGPRWLTEAVLPRLRLCRPPVSGPVECGDVRPPRHHRQEGMSHLSRFRRALYLAPDWPRATSLSDRFFRWAGLARPPLFETALRLLELPPGDTPVAERGSDRRAAQASGDGLPRKELMRTSTVARLRLDRATARLARTRSSAPARSDRPRRSRSSGARDLARRPDALSRPLAAAACCSGAPGGRPRLRRGGRAPARPWRHARAPAPF
jgi:hypothetical protein